MIEIICDKKYEDNDQQTEQENEGQDVAESISRKDGEEKNDTSVYGLPKNLRQVGMPSGSRRIYIEDYVVTYLNYIARPGNTDVRGAILVGEKRNTKTGEAIFISGAVDAQNVEFDMEECQFTQEIWEDIYSSIKENFPELSVVGWFLSRMGFSTILNSRIEKLHVENFPGSDKVLYVSDSLESEDAFYIYEKGQMVRQNGYYIYYAKNEQMQNYIIKQRGEKVGEKDTDIKRKDDELIKNYRSKNRQAQTTKTTIPGNGISIGYAVGAFAALVVVAMGITIAGNYKKMHNMQISINRLELTAETTENVEEKANPATVIPPDAESITTANAEMVMSPNTAATETAESTAVMENIAEPEAPIEGSIMENTNEAATETTNATTNEATGENTAVTSENTNNTNENTSVSENNVGENSHKVCYGDTLTSIAYEYYGSIEYVDAIAQANNMKANDKIYEGQNIILPKIE